MTLPKNGSSSRIVSPLLIVCISCLASSQLASAGGLEATGPGVSEEAQQAILLLDAKDLYTRQLAFLRLEALREPDTVPVIREYIDSRDPDTRAFSLRALAAVGRADAVPVLLDRIQHDHEPRVRLAAILAVEPLHDPRALPVLIRALKDRHHHVRMAAVDVVSRIDAPEAREAILIRSKKEWNHDVRRVLKDAVKRVTPQ